MTRIRSLLALVCLVFLAACGTKRESFVVVRDAFQTLVQSLQPKQGNLRDVLNYDVIAGLGVPYIFTEIELHQSQSGMILNRKDGPHEVWWPASYSTTITTKNSVVLQTRGIGADLMSSDVDEVIDALAVGAGTATRVHRFLDGENRIVAKAFFCEYENDRETVEILFGSYPARHVVETCWGSDDSFTNEYWFGDDGVMRKSIQWLTPVLGSILIERVTDG